MEIPGVITESIRSVPVRRIAMQVVHLGMVAASMIMMVKLCVCLSGCASPFVVVLTGSMEPAFKRGDVLFLSMSDSPVRSGDIIVFKTKGNDIPIVHRVTMVHERRDTGDVQVLTKGDNNHWDDRDGGIYPDGQMWLEQKDFIGRVCGFLPYGGWGTIILTENPLIKYLGFALGLFFII